MDDLGNRVANVAVTTASPQEQSCASCKKQDYEGKADRNQVAGGRSLGGGLGRVDEVVLFVGSVNRWSDWAYLRESIRVQRVDGLLIAVAHEIGRFPLDEVAPLMSSARIGSPSCRRTQVSHITLLQRTRSCNKAIGLTCLDMSRT